MLSAQIILASNVSLIALPMVNLIDPVRSLRFELLAMLTVDREAKRENAVKSNKRQPLTIMY